MRIIKRRYKSSQPNWTKRFSFSFDLWFDSLPGLCEFVNLQNAQNAAPKEGQQQEDQSQSAKEQEQQLQAMRNQLADLTKLHEELKTRSVQNQVELENMTKEKLCSEMEIQRLQGFEEELKKLNQIHNELQIHFAQNQSELERMTKDKMSGDKESQRVKALEEELKRLSVEHRVHQDAEKQNEKKYSSKICELQLALSCAADETERQIKNGHKRHEELEQEMV